MTNTKKTGSKAKAISKGAKVYILDTNVLIHDPDSINRFQDNIVCIPLSVIRELDGLKKDTGVKGYSSRTALRIIEKLRNGGSLTNGITLKEGGTLYVTNVGDVLNTDDNLIETAEVFKSNVSVPVIIVSKDVAVRIKANANNVLSEDYKTDKTTAHEKYGNLIMSRDAISTEDIRSIRYYLGDDEQIFRIDNSGMGQIKRGRSPFGISPKTKEQECAIDALLTPHIDVIALAGNAGTGKTLLALASALHQTNRKDSLYEQVIVTRPIVAIGNDLGYLPGDINDKLTPWMQPIFDNIEVLTHPTQRQRGYHQYNSSQSLIDAGILQVEALTYIRGRTLPRRYFIIDEAQNLRPIDVKTIITRCGEGTKIVFTGDISQIDAAYLDKDSNGLAYLIGQFINEPNFCYLKLNTTVRSKIAEQGARLL